MERALIGRIKTASSFLLMVKTRKTLRRWSVSPMPMKRSSAPEYSGSGNTETCPLEDAFDVMNRKTMLLALVAIALVPIELQATDLHWLLTISVVHTIVNTHRWRRRKWSRYAV